jgi:hypothetical protein
MSPRSRYNRGMPYVVKVNAGAAKSFAISGEARDYMQANSHKMDQV